MKFSPVIAIDGPSGSGKSTIAKMVAGQLNILYIDTGAMFRSLAYLLKERGFNIDEPNSEEEKKIEQELSKINFEYGLTEEDLVKIDGENLSKVIRDHKVSTLASQVSKITAVRVYLKELQRVIAGKNHSIMEGRDIGTIVFPNSYCKIFLTASADVRAKRRLAQLIEKGQTELDLETVKADIIKRDESDMNRAAAPLVKAQDGIELDTSELNLEEVIAQIIELSNQNKQKLS
jgi:cytidylate kinase